MKDHFKETLVNISGPYICEIVWVGHGDDPFLARFCGHVGAIELIEKEILEMEESDFPYGPGCYVFKATYLEAEWMEVYQVWPEGYDMEFLQFEPL